MRIIRWLHNLASDFANGCVATIGNYDGVHLGHQQILNFVREKSQELKLPSVVVIFEPQPEEFFTGDRFLRLTGLREKLFLLEKYGVDIVLLLSFNKRFASLSAKEFIQEVLVNGLHVRYLVIGDDFVFGHKREGDYFLLKKLGVLHGFQVTQMPAFEIDGERVSSTLVRAALLQGNIELATKLLGKPYKIGGKVVHGDHRGRDLGFPTANIYLKRRELPFTGVYAVKVCGLTQNPLLGIANIGFRPTVAGRHKLFEVYIFNFSENIYGSRVVVEFCKKIRDERKFNSLAELQLQIKKDLEVVRNWLKVL